MSLRDFVVLGRISAPFGVTGWVKAVSYTDPPEGLGGYAELLLDRDGVPEPRAIRGWKRAGRGIALSIEGCDSIEAARALAGLALGVARSALPEVAPGEFYLHDLKGLRARTVDGTELGTVHEVLELPAHPVLVLRGERERLVPCVAERLVAVDVKTGTITLDWHPED